MVVFKSFLPLYGTYQGILQLKRPSTAHFLQGAGTNYNQLHLKTLDSEMTRQTSLHFHQPNSWGWVSGSCFDAFPVESGQSWDGKWKWRCEADSRHFHLSFPFGGGGPNSTWHVQVLDPCMRLRLVLIPWLTLDPPASLKSENRKMLISRLVDEINEVRMTGRNESP